MIKHILTFYFLMILMYAVSAQKSEAKDYIISGNQRYMEGDFAKSEAQYKIALSEDSNSIKANYNLGNALYKQKRMDEARVHYDRVVQNSQASKSDKHKAYHNIGKSYLDENDPEKAVANLKEALKLNPHDDQTRYNYALARKLLEKQKEEEKEKNQNEDNQDENQDENKDNPENQDKEDSGEDGEDSKPQNQNGNQEGGKNGDEKGEGETPQNQNITKGDDGKGKSSSQPMNTERQEGLLEALRQQEQETLKKIISQKAQKVRVNTEKDW